MSASLRGVGSATTLYETIAVSFGVVRCRNPIEDGSRDAREYIICDLVLRSAFYWIPKICNDE
jgi:hypothetical protein